MADSRQASETEVRATVARVASRMRLADTLVWGARALIALGIAAVLAVASVRFAGVGRSVVLLALGMGGLATAIAVALLVRPVSTLVAASLADRELGLADRLTSAVSFLDERAPSALQRAAIADAARLGARVDPRRVVTLGIPRAARYLPVVLLALLGVSFVRLPGPIPKPNVSAPKPKLIVEADALAGEVEAVRQLAHEARGKDEQLAALAQRLDALLAAVDKQTLSRAEVFAQLASLEAQYTQKHAPGPLRPSELLAPAAKALDRAERARALAEALKKDNLEAARAELEKLATAAEQRDKDKQDEHAERELQRALEQASRNLDEAQRKADAERDKKIEQLKDEERRLQRQRRAHPEDEETERRLQRNKRELERLEREKQEQAEQRRQLQRLSKDMQEAAEELRKKMSPEAMKRMAEELGKMQDEIRKLGSSERAAQQIAELKEMLRRASRVEIGRGDSGEGADGKDQQGKGQQKGGRGDKLRDFDKRAGGETETLILGGKKPGDTTVLLPLPTGGGEGGEAGDKNGPGDPKGQGDPRGQGDPKGGGEGIGKDHDADLLGEATSMKTQQKLIRATGKAGAGPTRSQTILEASERGFSNKSYQRVYKDYSAVVEEVMSQEGVPPGYRYYVKRYFQLIRPRE